MITFTLIDEMSEPGRDIEIVNPALVCRLRAEAEMLEPHEIAALLADAILAAALAAHTRRWQEQLYSEASPDAIVDHEYRDEIVCAWTLIAVEAHVTIP